MLGLVKACRQIADSAKLLIKNGISVKFVVIIEIDVLLCIGPLYVSAQ